MLKVVAALIKKDNKILIAKRSTGNKDVIGKWEFPGGKVEENETEEQAIEREIKEEFDILVNAYKKCCLYFILNGRIEDYSNMIHFVQNK